jgi:transcriptional regulator with XRE-family HTH domain
MKTIPPEATLGDYLSSARTAKNLSYGQLAQRSGLQKSGIFAIEKGDVKSPDTDTLAKLATALDVPLADLYSLAGYAQPTELPSVQPYLRSKYGDLPPEARAEIADAFERISAKYGTDPTASGPAAGEDE